MFMIQVVTPEKMDFKKDSITDKRFAINVTMKYLYSFVISVTTYYVFSVYEYGLTLTFLN